MPDLSYRQPGLIMRKTGSAASNRQLRDLQKDLRRLGYLRSGIDGNFGDQTELAVKGLQHDLLEGASGGDDGTPAVLIRSYNRGRVTSITGEVDQNLVACISDMLDDANFATLPSTADPAAENRKIVAEISAMPSTTVPTAFLMAILAQESGLRHFNQPAAGDEDTFITVGLDRNVKGAPHVITSRAYGAGQYTLFHHPPLAAEVTDFMLDVGKNLRKATTELKDKFDHFILGPGAGARADDRVANFGTAPLRTCKFAPGDPRFMRDCKQCLLDAGRRDIKENQTPLFEGSPDVFVHTQYYDMNSPAYRNSPLPSDIGCDWPYAVRRYNGSGVNSYHYQVRVLQHLLANDAAQTSIAESTLAPFDLGKYRFSIGATTVLHSASSSAAEKDAPVSTSFVLLEIAGQGRLGRERQWAADFLLDAVSAQPGKFQEVVAQFRDGKQGFSPGQQESSSRPEASMMKPGLAWSLNRAQEIATETTGEATICGRHLLAGLIADVPQPYAVGAQRLLAKMGVDIPLLRQRMYDWVRGYGDDDTRWHALLIGTSREPRRKVEFTADTTTGLDLIGIEQDVLALATLIAARDSSPPLSIGLFGDWGSGKTFFMGQLRSTVAQFSKEAREASVMQRDLPFYKHIVQIDFNAWHYVEGNLWASMVEHILENLRVSDDQRLTVTEEMQQRWIVKLGFTEKAKAEADKKNTEAAARVSRAETDVQAAVNTHEEKKRELQTLSRKSAARDFKLSGAVQAIADSLEPLGLKPLSDAAADLQSSLRQAKSAVEGGNAVLSPLIYAKDKIDRWRSLIIILLAAPFAAAAIGWVLNELGHAQMAQISAWATGAAGLLGCGARWLRKQAEWVSEQSRKVEKAQRTYDEALVKELASTADQIAKTEQELALARQDYILAQQRAEQARREQDAALSDLAAATTARLLGQFIQDRAASTDYRKHLGVLALVRQDFQKLSSLIEEDNWRLAPPGPDDQRFLGRQLRKITSLEEETADAVTRINRIVLYIDDLDRCPPAKVVEVLQAVHLLLAFPLFVVVVGVDARWISRSLESRYRELLHFGQANAAVDVTEMFGVARSEDYLEKIFQIPLWLRRMDVDTAQRMVQGLLGRRMQSTSKKSEDSVMTNDAKPAAPSLSQNVVQLNQAAGVGQQASVPSPAAAPAVIVEHSAETPAAPTPMPTSTAPAKPIVSNLQSLEVRDFEISAIDELAPLLGRSPRALKRFVNLYRLIKAGLTPAEHNAFVRHSQDALGGFQAVLFLLAIDTGLPRVSRLVFDTLLEMRESGDLGVKQMLEKVHEHPSANTVDWNTLRDWIGALNGPEKFDRGMAVIAEWVPRVARYSFQASHIEGIRELPERVPKNHRQ